VIVAKPIVRIGIDVDSQTWKTLLKVEKFDGVRTYDFLIDTSQPTVWLYLVGESEEVFGRLHDITTKEGGLPMKSAGEWRESAETFNAYFRATVLAVRLELRLKETVGGPEADYQAAKEDYSAAVRTRDTAKETFEAAMKRDTGRAAEFDESFENSEGLYDHLGPAN
jgi:hypothetical protein